MFGQYEHLLCVEIEAQTANAIATSQCCHAVTNMADNGYMPYLILTLTHKHCCQLINYNLWTLLLWNDIGTAICRLHFVPQIELNSEKKVTIV